MSGPFLRYAIVGVVSNALLYALYLLATGLGVAPEAAMTALYILGVLQTFLVNQRWSFRSTASGGRAFRRYGIAYGSGYVINAVALAVAVDRFGLPHRLVQAVLIVTIAVYLFLLQRFWVFAPAAAAPPGSMAAAEKG